MFGKRSTMATTRPPIPAGALPPSFADSPTRTKPDDIARMGFAAGRSFTRSEKYFEIKRDTFTALIDGIDLAELAKLNADDARRELRQLAGEIVNLGPASCHMPSAKSCLRTSATTCSAWGRSNRCSPRTASPTL